MPSYREQLSKIGIGPGAPVSWSSFASKPRSLRTAMRAMDAPAQGDWHQVDDAFADEFWTDEVQGIAFNGTHWIFSTNANQDKPDVEDKALYVFAPDTPMTDDGWVTRLKFKDVPHPYAGALESHSHWGQITYYQGHLYVSHFWTEDSPRSGQSSVVVFECSGAHLSFSRWVTLGLSNTRSTLEFQAINPWDGLFYSCEGGRDPRYEIYRHDPKDGSVVGDPLRLNIPLIHNVQGACFSDNGHLYVVTNHAWPDEEHQTIHCYSALNGVRLGVIPVLAEEGYPTQELEGLCIVDGRIHVVLLENPDVALDNIFVKTLITSTPDIV